MVICLERGADCLHIVQLMPLHPKTPSHLASFKSRLIANLLAWYGTKTKPNTRQKHAFINQKKCTTTQHKHEKTKARFSRLLRQPAWERSRSILKGKDKGRDTVSKEKVKKKGQVGKRTI